jgi:hypothetical protein
MNIKLTLKQILKGFNMEKLNKFTELKKIITEMEGYKNKEYHNAYQRNFYNNPSFNIKETSTTEKINRYIRIGLKVCENYMDENIRWKLGKTLKEITLFPMKRSLKILAKECEAEAVACLEFLEKNKTNFKGKL